MQQGTLFDLDEARAKKSDGMALAASNRKQQLAVARDYAVKFALENGGECCADDVQRHMIKIGADLGNAAGSIFKGSQWEWTGRFKQSHRVSRHANMIRIWKLRP